jgi:hypothetical protein
MSIQQTGQTVIFYAFFTASKIGKTGLSVTVDIYSPSNTLLVMGGSALAVGGGLYYYSLTGASTGTAGDYKAIFKTADTTVDRQHEPALWVLGPTWTQNLDAAVSTRSSHTAAQAAQAVWDYLVSAATTVGSLGKRLVDFLDVAISSRLADEDYTAGTGGATAAEIWSNPERTLTQPAAQVAAIVAGADLTIKRTTAAVIALTGLGSLEDRTQLWFSIKRKASDADSEAMIHLTEADGLVYLDGAAAPENTSSLVVTNELTGALSISLDAAATRALGAGKYAYDIKALFPTGPRVLTEGTLAVTPAVTHAIS